MEKPNPNNNLANVDSQNSAVSKVDINQLFAGDSYGLFLFKKTEKIVTAIYLLTSLMSDKEPMKERLRTLATGMLGSALSMSERVWGEEGYQKNLLSATSEISTLFDIAERTKMISRMNYEIITTELQKFAGFLVTSSSNYSSAKIAFEPNLFDSDYNYVPEQNFQSKLNEGQKENLSGQIISKGQRDVKDNTTDSTVLNNKSISKPVKSEKIVKDKSNRQGIIISMLKGGLKLTVRDFAKNIKGCSEKTIQRELINMVSKGVLKKEGERRWSKYFLA